MKTLIITGISRGIGLATASLFLEKGYHVIGTSTAGKTILTSDRLSVFSLQLDDASSFISLKDHLLQNSIKVDGIINNAAVLLEAWDDPSIDIQQLRKTFDINVFGTIEFTENLLPFIKKNGHIINIGSSWGTFNTDRDAYTPLYKMSKTTIHMYTSLLGERLKTSDIAVSAVDPGWVKTDMGSMDAEREPQEAAMDIFSLFESPKETGYLWREGEKSNW